MGAAPQERAYSFSTRLCASEYSASAASLGGAVSTHAPHQHRVIHMPGGTAPQGRAYHLSTRALRLVDFPWGAVFAHALHQQRVIHMCGSLWGAVFAHAPHWQRVIPMGAAPHGRASHLFYEGSPPRSIAPLGRCVCTLTAPAACHSYGRRASRTSLPPSTRLSASQYSASAASLWGAVFTHSLHCSVLFCISNLRSLTSRSLVVTSVLGC